MLREEVRAHVALVQGDVGGFLAALEAMMAGVCDFKQIQDKLDSQIVEQVEPPSILRMFTASIDQLVQRPVAQGHLTKQLLHLLLNLVPRAVQRWPEGPELMQAEAAALLRHCCEAREARVAAKIAVNFQMTEQSLEGGEFCQDAMEAYVKELLEDAATFHPAVTLMLQFPMLQGRLPTDRILEDIVAAGQENLAARLAEALGNEAKGHVVTACIDTQRLRAAAGFVREWRLRADFPDVERQYKERGMEKLADRQLWDVAASFAGQDAGLQAKLLERMALEGEAEQAEVYRLQWGLPATLLQVDPEVLQAREARERATYLQLDIPLESLHFVSEPEQVAKAVRQLLAAPVIGLDTEWRASHEPGSTNGSAIALLQLGTGSEVFVVDMPALHACEELDRGLALLMESDDIAIVGFEIAGDLKKLASSYPRMQAFKAVNRIVELQRMWRPAAARKSSKQMSFGLSKLSEVVLGRPLNKAMQVSNWEARPLSHRQLTYAALDAHVCVRIFNVMLHDRPGCDAAAVFSFPQPRNKSKVATDAKDCSSPGLKRGRGKDDDDDSGGAGGGTGGNGTSAGRGSPGAGQQGTQAVADGVHGGTNSGSQDASQGKQGDGDGQGQRGKGKQEVGFLAATGPESLNRAAAQAILELNQLLPLASGSAAPAAVLQALPLLMRAALMSLGLSAAFRVVGTTEAKANSLVTCPGAAVTLAVAGCQVAKTMAVVAGHQRQPWLLVLRGERRADFRKARPSGQPPPRGNGLPAASAAREAPSSLPALMNSKRPLATTQAHSRPLATPSSCRAWWTKAFARTRPLPPPLPLTRAAAGAELQRSNGCCTAVPGCRAALRLSPWRCCCCCAAGSRWTWSWRALGRLPPPRAPTMRLLLLC